MIERIEQPSQELLRWLAKLHRDSLQGDFLATLGVLFLCSFYSALKGNRFYVFTSDGKPVGALVATDHRERIRHNLIRYGFFSLSWSLFLSLLRHPHLIPTALHAFTYGSQSTGAELLFLGVEKDSRSKGIGSELLKRYVTDLKKDAIGSFEVVVGKSNEAAQKFYERHGAREYGEVKVGKNSLVRMMLMIR